MVHVMRALSIIAAGLLLAACSSTVDCEVVCYHDLKTPAGERVQVIADSDRPSDADQFDSVAEQVRTALNGAGYTAVTEGSADLVFAISYGVGTGPDQQERMPRCADNYIFKDDNYGAPYYSGLECYEQEPELINNHLHFLEVKVYDAVSMSIGDSEPLYDGLVQSLSWSDNLAQMTPYLVTALFDGFPGESGKVRRVTVTFEKPSD